MPSNLYTGSKDYITNHYENLGDFKNDFRTRNLYNLISHLVSGKKILDIGCATGMFLNILKKNGKDVYGIEPNVDLVEIAKKINPEIKIIQGYSDSIIQIEEQMDTITIIDVLEHIDDDEKLISLIYKKLKPNGRLIVLVPCFKLLYGKRDINLGHYRRYSKDELKNKLKKNGFLIETTRYWNAIGFFPYLISEKLFRKELNTNLRTRKGEKSLRRVFLDFWFKYIEKSCNFGFGLSLLCVAQKIEK